MGVVSRVPDCTSRDIGRALYKPICAHRISEWKVKRPNAWRKRIGASAWCGLRLVDAILQWHPMTSHYRSAGDAITRMLLPGLLHLTSDPDARAVFLAANGPELLAARLYAWAPDGMPRGQLVDPSESVGN
jgi:hypothetical protein